MDKNSIYAEVLGLIDLTSLNPTDTPSSVRMLTGKVNDFHRAFPSYRLPASICVFPNFAGTVKSCLTADDVHVTVVGGCFPASQSPLEVKLLECSKAASDGADEIDIVLALNSFLEHRYDDAQNEIKSVIKTVRSVNPKVLVKVILETGALKDHAMIEDASFLAMEAGADFIKTSTGKLQPAATLEAARIMCGCIGNYFKRTGRMVGFKPAGGISTPEDAVAYYSIVSDILGPDWLDKNHFRFGASRMANNLLSALEGKEIKYF